jgi:Flp pilus assembly pilin Flp
MRGRIRRRLRDERGQSFVEFTLLLPMALVLILGVVDLARATSYWLDSSHLANEGARAAAVHSCPAAPPVLPPGVSPPDCTTPSASNGLPKALWIQGQTPQLRDKLTVCIWDLHPAVDPLTGAADPLAGQPRLDGDPWIKQDEIRVTVRSKFTFIPFLKLVDRTMTGRSSMRLETDWGTSPTTNPYGWTFQAGGSPSGTQAGIGNGEDQCPGNPN